LNRFLIFFWVVLFLVLPGLLFFESCFESVFVFLRGCATRLAKSKQPLSHSARAAAAATQPLCQSGCRSHSTTQPLRVAEWLVQSLLPERLSSWVAAPATLSERLSFTFKLFFGGNKEYINLVCMVVMWSNKAIVASRCF
jgi:hypothetical protein